MKCPICEKEMTRGDIIFRNSPYLTFVPKCEQDLKKKHTLSDLFRGKDSIIGEGPEGGWYCPECKKIFAMWNEMGKNFSDGTDTSKL